MPIMPIKYSTTHKGISVISKVVQNHFFKKFTPSYFSTDCLALPTPQTPAPSRDYVKSTPLRQPPDAFAFPLS
ncbi:hypothetical protein MEZE111188_00380 [Mesobacillus zeae]